MLRIFNQTKEDKMRHVKDTAVTQKLGIFAMRSDRFLKKGCRSLLYFCSTFKISSLACSFNRSISFWTSSICSIASCCSLSVKETNSVSDHAQQSQQSHKYLKLDTSHPTARGRGGGNCTQEQEGDIQVEYTTESIRQKYYWNFCTNQHVYSAHLLYPVTHFSDACASAPSYLIWNSVSSQCPSSIQMTSQVCSRMHLRNFWIMTAINNVNNRKGNRPIHSLLALSLKTMHMAVPQPISLLNGNEQPCSFYL